MSGNLIPHTWITGEIPFVGCMGASRTPEPPKNLTIDRQTGVTTIYAKGEVSAAQQCWTMVI